MDQPLTFDIAITDTEIILRFDKASFPTEVTGVEAAYQQLEAARRAGDAQLAHIATIQLQQRILALLRAPSHEQAMQRGH